LFCTNRVIIESIRVKNMIISKLEIADWNNLDLPTHGRLRRARLLTPLGWFAILAILAVVTGVALGFIA
jgi:hypothetical protein